MNLKQNEKTLSRDSELLNSEKKSALPYWKRFCEKSTNLELARRQENSVRYNEQVIHRIHQCENSYQVKFKQETSSYLFTSESNVDYAVDFTLDDFVQKDKTYQFMIANENIASIILRKDNPKQQKLLEEFDFSINMFRNKP